MYVIHSLLLSSFFPVISEEIKIKTFSWALVAVPMVPGGNVSPRGSGQIWGVEKTQEDQEDPCLTLFLLLAPSSPGMSPREDSSRCVSWAQDSSRHRGPIPLRRPFTGHCPAESSLPAFLELLSASLFHANPKTGHNV